MQTRAENLLAHLIGTGKLLPDAIQYGTESATPSVWRPPMNFRFRPTLSILETRETPSDLTGGMTDTTTTTDPLYPTDPTAPVQGTTPVTTDPTTGPTYPF